MKIKTFLVLAFAWVLTCPHAAQAQMESNSDEFEIISLEKLELFSSLISRGESEAASALALEISAEIKPSVTGLDTELIAELSQALLAAGEAEAARDILQESIRRQQGMLEEQSEPITRSELIFYLIELLDFKATIEAQLGQAMNVLETREHILELSQELYGSEDPALRFALRDYLEARSASDSEPRAELRQQLERLEYIATQPERSNLGGTPAVEDVDFKRINLFYGTMRNDFKRDDPGRTFGNDRSELTFGAIEITVPSSRTPGTIPRQPGLMSWGKAADGVHLVFKRMDRFASEDLFAEAFGASLDKAENPGREAFVYIHGHAVTFRNAAQRTAVLAVDLDLRNGAVLYAWPTHGRLTGYNRSRENAEFASDGLYRLLTTILSEADTVHIISHSMGSRVVMPALQRLEREVGGTTTQGKIGDIVWASPDYDTDLFVQAIGQVYELDATMTLYASENDRALGLSRWVAGGYPRAGQTPVPVALAQALNVVDTSATAKIDRDLVNHADYASGAVSDLVSRIWLDVPSETRCYLRTQTIQTENDTATFWKIDPRVENCAPRDFRRAASMVRLYGNSATDRIIQVIEVLRAEGDPADILSWINASQISTVILHRLSHSTEQ